MKLKNTLFIIFVFIAQLSFSQKDELTTKSSKAKKHFYNATKAYEINDYTSAINEVKEAIAADDRFVEAYTLLGDIYSYLNKPEDAADAYKKAVEINPTYFPNTVFYLGQAEVDAGRYEDAKKHLLQFLNFKDTKPDKQSTAKDLIDNCDFAVEAVKHPVPFSPVNAGPNINTADEEYFPSLTVDDSLFLFTRRIHDDMAPMGLQEEFFMSVKKNGEWQKAFNIGPPINTELNEGAPSFSADGKLIFFTACNRPEGKGSCDIYYTRRVGNKWTKPINLGAPVNTGLWESQPSFSSDGKTLYFLRGTPRTNGKDNDIYMSQVSEKGWSEPVKLPSNINTSLKEESVFIHPDNQTLFFTSNGHPGMGGTDIFVSKRREDGKWGDPVNLGYPINTSKDETGLIVSPKGDIAYFSSKRDGGYGGLDIYKFNLYDAIKPIGVSYVKGRVFDSDTKSPLEAKFEIIDIASGKTVTESWSDKSNGDFLVPLPVGKEYALNVSKDGYLFYSDHFSLKNESSAKNAYPLDVSLTANKPGSKVILKNIFFDTNASDLKPESNAELDKLVYFMKKNIAVKVEISGHTDNVGDDKTNQMLSEKRAQSVFNYLVKSGVAETRLSAKGYGESKPIATNETEEGRSQNRRTEFTITAVN